MLTLISMIYIVESSSWWATSHELIISQCIYGHPALRPSIFVNVYYSSGTLRCHLKTHHSTPLSAFLPSDSAFADHCARL